MKNQKSYLILAIVLVLAGLLTFSGRFGNTKMIAKTPGGAPASPAQKAIPESSWPEQENKALEHLKEDQKLQYKSISDKQDALTLSQKAEFWRDHKHFSLYGHYIAEKTKLEKTQKSLTFATPLLIEILNEETVPAVKSLLADDIMALSALGNDIFGSSDVWEYAEAIALIEGKNETMPGVQKLLAITRKDPKNLEANLMLAKLAIQSGQYDKSIDRLTKLLKNYPDNTEAMFFLAEAYKSSGNKEKAKQWLNKCKEQVNDPDFTAEIDQYLTTF